jgi:hypothetical protein
MLVCFNYSIFTLILALFHKPNLSPSLSSPNLDFEKINRKNLDINDKIDSTILQSQKSLKFKNTSVLENKEIKSIIDSPDIPQEKQLSKTIFNQNNNNNNNDTNNNKVVRESGFSSGGEDVNEDDTISFSSLSSVYSSSDSSSSKSSSGVSSHQTSSSDYLSSQDSDEEDSDGEKKKLKSVGERSDDNDSTTTDSVLTTTSYDNLYHEFSYNDFLDNDVSGEKVTSISPLNLENESSVLRIKSNLKRGKSSMLPFSDWSHRPTQSVQISKV